MLQFLEKAGPLSYVLVFLAFLSMLVILERVFFFQRVRINVGKLLLGISNHVRHDAYAEAIHEAGRAPGPVARVIYIVLLRRNLPRQDLRDIAQETGQLEVHRLERNLRILYAIAVVSPLIGILGTMVGLTKTFSEMSREQNFASPSEMTQGVYESLLTSVMGLSIAVPVYLFYLFFYGRIKRIVHRIERAGIEIINMVCDARQEGEIVPFEQ